MRGRIFTAKRDLDERPRSWCFTTCCEMRLMYRLRTLCGDRNYLDTTTMCCVRLGPRTGKRRTWRTGSHLFARSTIMLALIQAVGRCSGVNGSNQAGSECVVRRRATFVLAALLVKGPLQKWRRANSRPDPVFRSRSKSRVSFARELCKRSRKRS
jgi:hypothetical protein